MVNGHACLQGAVLLGAYLRPLEAIEAEIEGLEKEIVEMLKGITA